MESLSYLQVAFANDPFVPTTSTPPRARFFRKLHWKKLSSIAWFSLLTAAVIISIVSITIPALAALYRGSRGAEVTALQTQLRDAGFFNGPISGIYGPITESAVKQFQSKVGLTADGVAGDRTLAILQQQVPRAQASYSSSTLELQQLLAKQGFNPGPVDGVYGSKTRAAVREAQQTYGLVVDGIAGSATLAALRRGTQAPQTSYSSSSSTLELQRLLANQGFNPGPVDGVYGSKTRAAVRAAQQTYGLAVDGIAGSATLAALRRQSTRETQQYSAGTAELQQLLANKGFYSGPIDGMYGSSTKAAVRSAQQAYGLVVDGIAGPATLSILRRGQTPQASGDSSDVNVVPVPAPPPRVRTGDPTSVSSTGVVQQASPAVDIMYLQKLLVSRGFYDGSPDGVYGSRTRDAVIKAQRYYSLTADGVAGPQTIKALEGSR